MSAKRRFVLCLDNKGYEASLIERKIYEVIPDAHAEKDDLIRLVDKMARIIFSTPITLPLSNCPKR